MLGAAVAAREGRLLSLSTLDVLLAGPQRALRASLHPRGRGERRRAALPRRFRPGLRRARRRQCDRRRDSGMGGSGGAAARIRADHVAPRRGRRRRSWPARAATLLFAGAVALAAAMHLPLGDGAVAAAVAPGLRGGRARLAGLHYARRRRGPPLLARGPADRCGGAGPLPHGGESIAADDSAVHARRLPPRRGRRAAPPDSRVRRVLRRAARRRGRS